MNFYVYIYKNPLKDLEPFYVGKGQEDRKIYHLFDSHLRDDPNKHKVNTIRKIWRAKLEPIIEIVSHHVDEQEAFDEETRLIKKIGRADLGLGPLTNMTDGGEGTVNKIITDEYRKKLSDGTKRALAEGRAIVSDAFRFSQLGKKQSPEWVAKKAESKRKTHAVRGYKTQKYVPKGNPKAIPVMVFGVLYPSIGKAIKATGLTPIQVRREAHV